MQNFHMTNDLGKYMYGHFGEKVYTNSFLNYIKLVLRYILSVYKYILYIYLFNYLKNFNFLNILKNRLDKYILSH